MARVSGSFKQGFITSGAAATGIVEDWLELMDTEVGTATSVTMTINVSIACHNAGDDTYTAKLSATCAATSLANAKLQLADVVTTCLTAIVTTHGAYATIDTVDVSVSAVMSN